MKLATFTRGGRTAVGVVDISRNCILDLAEASRAATGKPDAAFASMLDLIDAEAAGLDRARAVADVWPNAASYDLGSVRLLAPIPVPRQMRDCLTFELHLRNAIAQTTKKTGIERPFPEVWFKQPIYYKANRFSFIGHETDVVWPKYSNHMDYELELACVIGKTGKDITPR